MEFRPSKARAMYGMPKTQNSWKHVRLRNILPNIWSDTGTYVQRHFIMRMTFTPLDYVIHRDRRKVQIKYSNTWKRIRTNNVV